MAYLIIFLAASAGFVYLSRRSLLLPQSHGFYRFFAWESILALVLLNHPVWFRDPFAPLQWLSWLLLAASVALVVHGVVMLKVVGKPAAERGDAELFAFEKTTELVRTGAYRYIRHPMYASLLLLAWGAFLKDVSWASAILVALASLSLYLTAKRDEAECAAYFGAGYHDYRKSTRYFLPFVW